MFYFCKEFEGKIGHRSIMDIVTLPIPTKLTFRFIASNDVRYSHAAMLVITDII
jgi:hypothetical protein